MLIHLTADQRCDIDSRRRHNYMTGTSSSSNRRGLVPMVLHSDKYIPRYTCLSLLASRRNPKYAVGRVKNGF